MSQELALLTRTRGADPRAIVAAAIAAPMKLHGSVEFDPNKPARFGGGALAPGRNELTIPADDGTLVRSTTPEHLLAIVATLIATSPDAQTACVRIRQEVQGWKFQDAEGKIR